MRAATVKSGAKVLLTVDLAKRVPSAFAEKAYR